MIRRKTTVLFLVAVLAFVGSAISAKSLYVLASHHYLEFDAWNVNPGGSVAWQGTYNLQFAYAPAGVAVHEPSKTLFISSESPNLEVVDATTFASLGQLPGIQFAGLAVDDKNDILYAMKRSSNSIYAYDFTRTGTTWSLTLRAGFPQILNELHYSSGMGIVLDELSDPPILWVADCGNMMIRAYDTSALTWTEDATLSFSTASTQRGAIGMGMDRRRGILYWGSMTYGAGTPPNSGSYYLYKYDLNTQALTSHYIGHDKEVVDTSADEDTGFVYITETDHMSVWDTTTTPWTMKQRNDFRPRFQSRPATAGLAVTNVSFQPDLTIEKADNVAEGECAGVDDTIQYTVPYANAGDADLTGVSIVDDMPPGCDMVSPGGGVYDPSTHKVSWAIGDLAVGESGSVVLDVRVNDTVNPGSTMINYVTSDSDQTNVTTVQEYTLICTNRPPDCTNATPTVDELWPPNHRMVPVGVEGITDPDDDPISITVTSIYQDEPVDTHGDGSFAPDGVGVGTDSCEIRAERCGTPGVPGNGRVYHISFTADDGEGGACGGIVAVAVPHDRRRGGAAIDDGPLYDSSVP